MKIAFTTKGTEWDSPMDARFGRTEFLLIYDEDKNELSHYDNRDSANDAHGAGPKTARKVFELNPEIVITGIGPGGNTATVLEKTGIKIFTGAIDMTVKEAIEHFKKGLLKEA